MIKWYRKKKILKELREKRPLPLGREEAVEWVDRIIELAAIPGATIDSQRFAVFEMVLHVAQGQSFESYGWFVHRLRRGAANQVAHSLFTELKEARNAQTKNEVLANAKI